MTDEVVSPEVREYEQTMTCDSCAAGDVPVRVEGDAYICQRCDDEHDEAVAVAATVGQATEEEARCIVDAYLAHREQQARSEAGVLS